MITPLSAGIISSHGGNHARLPSRPECRFSALLLAALSISLLAHGAPVTRTWNGSTDGNWSTAANWTPGGSPSGSSPYDSVVFSGAANLATTNDLSSLSVSNFTFAAGGFSLSGNSLIIRSSINNQAGVNVVAAPVTLANNPKTWDVAAGAEIDFVGGTSTATYTGNPPFEKTDAGDVRFKGTNWWAQGADISGGGAIIDGGSLTVTNDGFRLIAANGAWARLVITNGGSLTLGANSVGKNFNLKLGSTTLLTGTNELDISSGQILLGQTLTQFIVGDQTGTYGIVNQNGGAILYQSANPGNDLLIANQAGAVGIYNLNGGLLQAPVIIGGAKGGTSYFNFNGGTLTPYTAVNANNFIQGLTAATVGNGGAIIDTTNINLTIYQPLLKGGSGGLTKLGTGTLTLAGANTYAGPTAVTAGELIVPTVQAGGGPITLADSTGLGVTVTAPGTSLNAAAVVLGAGATNEFFLGAEGNPPAPVINATNLTVKGTTTLNIYGAGFSLGQFPLIKYGSATGLADDSFQISLLPTGVAAHLVNNPANHSLDLAITAAPTILWTGAINNSWDIEATANWYDPIAGQTVNYSDGTAVQFDDTATGATAINLATPVSPGGVTITNNTLTYSFGGAGIGGPGAFTKSGSGTVILGTANTYTGNTTLNGGWLQLATSQAIPGGAGFGNVTVNGGLDLAGNSQTINGLNGAGWIDSSTGSGTLTIGANNASGTFTGSITNSGGTLALVKAGTGAETLTANNAFSGGVTVAGGTLQVGPGSLGSGSLMLQVPASGVTLASYAGPLALTNPVYVFGASGGPTYFDTTGGDILLENLLTGTGPDIFKKGYHDLRIEPAGGGYSAGGVLHLTQGNLIIDGGAWTNLSNGTRFYAAGSDIVRLVVTNGGAYAAGFGGNSTYGIQLGYVASLTGTNELDISSGQILLGPSFNQINAGNAVGTYGVINQSGGTILFQGNTSTSAGVRLGNSLGATGQYYLNGGTLIAPRIVGASGSGYLYLNGGTLTPSTTTAAASFISGLTAAYVGDGGAIFDTAAINVAVPQSLLAGGAGGLTKLGAATLQLGGTNTYTGPTVVTAGELWLPTTQLGGGSIAVVDGAALGITLNPGNPTIAASALTLGNSTLEFNLGNAVGPLVHAASLTVNGTVRVNVIGSQLGAGQFSLVQYDAASGLTSASFQLGDAILAPGLAAAIVNDPANSSIDLRVTVTAGGPPVNLLTAAVTGNQLNLQWPADYQSWTLEAQTNHAGGLEAKWTPIAAAGATRYSATIDPNQSSVFFRLVPPAP